MSLAVVMITSWMYIYVLGCLGTKFLDHAQLDKMTYIDVIICLGTI